MPKQMLRHIVLFKLKPECDADVRAKAVQELLTLRDVPGVRALAAGEAVNQGSFDLALTVDFDDLASYQAYGPHPVHMHVWGDILQPLTAEVTSVQFSYTA